MSGRCHTARKLADDFIVTSKILGSGCNGEVRLATSRFAAGKEFAVKSFSLRSLSTAERAELEAEVTVSLSLDHPNLVKVVDAYEADGCLDLVMERLEGVELYDMVEKGNFSERSAACAVGQILSALAYMHAKEIVHRDVKLENVMYVQKGSDHLKLIDFGVSDFLKAGFLTGQCGTDDYMAPEVWRGRYTDRCDIWSLGVLTFVLLSGRMPFSGDGDELRKRIVRGKYAIDGEPWRAVSADARSFVQSLLEIHATRRISAREALAHPWIAGVARKDAVNPSTLTALRAFPSLPLFERRSLAMMALSLSSAEEEVLREQFKAFDVSCKGAITLQELKDIATSSGVGDILWVEEAFSSLSSSRGVGGAGEVRYSDFLAAMIPAHVHVSDGMLRLAFRRFDVEASGTLTSRDLSRFIDETVEDTDAEALVREANLSRSGAISFPEFVAFMRGGRWRRESAAPHLPRQFDLPVCLGNTEPCDGAKMSGMKFGEARGFVAAPRARGGLIPLGENRSCAEDCTAH